MIYRLFEPDLSPWLKFVSINFDVALSNLTGAASMTTSDRPRNNTFKLNYKMKTFNNDWCV